jgi:Ca2+-binding RTX toxin-like protein
MIGELASAKAAYERGDISTTTNILGAFVNHVEAQRGKHITTDASDLLISMAQLLAQGLGETSGGSIDSAGAMSASALLISRSIVPSLANKVLIPGGNLNHLFDGLGADRIISNAGDDLLIGGSASYDGNAAALAMMLDEWTSPHDYASRIANLLGTGSGSTFANRLNSNYFLQPGVTVFDDGAQHQLTGSAGQDCFFAKMFGPGELDKITGFSKDEIVTDL